MFVLGVDGGTESLRATVFDLSGKRIGTASSPYDTQFGSGTRVEQNPSDWWRAAGSAVRQAVADAGLGARDIAALCCATTCCTVVALDGKGDPLRPALLWMDVRAGAEAQAVLETGDPALAVNGAGQGPVSAEWMVPKALWLARHEPDTLAAAHTVCEYQDFINWRLTGRRVASLNNASIRWHYSTARGGWPVSLLERLGLAALHDKWPADVLAPGAVIGPLTAGAAAHLGLTEATVVVQGGADALIGMIGLGVARPGQLALITGSSHLQFAVGTTVSHVPGLWGAYSDAVYPGRTILEGGQTSTGSIVAWLRRLTGDAIDLETLNAEAAKLGPGADGLLVMDHFQGNRTPHTDPLARGAITGLSLNHTAAHLFRAMLEGIGFGTRAVIDRMAAAGFGAAEITAGGGATRSPLWLQIHADTTGLPVVVPELAEAPSLGSAGAGRARGGSFRKHRRRHRGDGSPWPAGGADRGQRCPIRRGLPPLRSALPGAETGARRVTPNTRLPELYRTMRRIRSFEERVAELYVRGLSAGSMLHLSIGEEGAAAGVTAAMKPQDTFTTHHRGHGIFLARGADPALMMAEIAGRDTGYCRGKGGSMHIADMALGHLGANAIVGGGIPHVVGAGLAAKRLGTDAVSVAFFGDGAMQQGILYESMNMAAIWDLPVVFVCVNNQYGMGTRIDRATRSLEFDRRAAAFGLAASMVDGEDVQAVVDATQPLVDGARQGRPGFLAVSCFRFFGHGRMDKSPYRTADEETVGRKRDPVLRARDALLSGALASDSELDALDAEVAREMDATIDFAGAAPLPAPASMFRDVYGAGEPEPEPLAARLDRVLGR